MPAINVNMYVRVPKPVVPLWTTGSDNINVAVPISTDPKQGQTRIGYNQLAGTVYYVFEPNSNPYIGYLYIPNNYYIDLQNSCYIFSNGSWEHWNVGNQIRLLNQTATLDGETYNVYECSRYDKDEETWVGITHSFCFNLTENI
jgi:hypothetical protein